MTNNKMKTDENACGKKCEVYSRVVGYFRPVAQWNVGKKEEFKDRLEYDEQTAISHKFKSEVAAKPQC
jgi:anaerobic ribonucleoside-triphosphate reductase